jgi:glutaredoxin 3
MSPSMSKIEIYTRLFCPYCSRAKRLLEQKGVTFEEIDLMDHPERREEMIRRAGGRTTVPQIFIDGRHVGGSDELAELDRAGQLDPLLGPSG